MPTTTSLVKRTCIAASLATAVAFLFLSSTVLASHWDNDKDDNHDKDRDRGKINLNQTGGGINILNSNKNENTNENKNTITINNTSTAPAPVRLAAVPKTLPATGASEAVTLALIAALPAGIILSRYRRLPVATPNSKN